MARNRRDPFHANFSQSLDEQGLELSSVPSFLVGGSRFADAEADAATHFSAAMVVVVGVRTSIGNRSSAARPS